MTTRDRVRALLQHSEPLPPATVATRLDLPYERVKKAMQRMTRAGVLTVTNGLYTVRVPHSHDRERHGVAVRVLERDEWEDGPTWWLP